MRSLLAACATLAALVLAAPAGATPPQITLFAGVPGEAGTALEGPVGSSHLDHPTAVVFDSHGDAYIADTSNREVERVTPLGQLSVIAGDGTKGLPTPGEGPNAARDSELGEPEGLAINESGDLYIADSYADVVEEVTPAGALSIVAGKPGEEGEPTEGSATSSKLKLPTDVALDSRGDVYIADWGNAVVEKVTPEGRLSIVAGEPGHPGGPTEGPVASSRIGDPAGLALDSSGNLYIADESYDLIEEVTAAGHLSVVAGHQSTPGGPGIEAAPVEGPATSSPMFTPVGLAFDPAGDLYLSEVDFYHSTSCEIDAITAGRLRLVAGAGPCGHSTYGVPAAQSALDYPYYFAFDPLGDLYVPDYLSHTIERISPETPDPPVSASSSPTVNTPVTTAPTQCHSDRTERIHWRLARGVGVQRILVTLNGRRYRALPGSAREVTVSLAGHGAGRAVVRVIAVTRSGRRHIETRTFHPCYHGVLRGARLAPARRARR